MPGSAERKDPEADERSKNFVFHFPNSFIFCTLIGVPSPSRHRAPAVLSVPDSLQSPWGRCRDLQSSSREKTKPLTALLGIFKKEDRGLARGKKNGSRYCSICSGSFRIQFNPGLIVKGRGWKRGKKRKKKKRQRESEG